MIVYKVVPASLWAEAEGIGRFEDAPVDRADGYIHLSTAGQLATTLAKHFAGQDDLLLVAVDADALGPSLRWEPSRGGDLFPHLYEALPTTAAGWVRPINRDPGSGQHLLPDGWDAA